MRRTAHSSFACAPLLVLLFAAVVEGQTMGQPVCTLATLNGAYGLMHNGVVFGPEGHLAEVGIARFDG